MARGLDTLRGAAVRECAGDLAPNGCSRGWSLPNGRFGFLAKMALVGLEHGFLLFHQLLLFLLPSK
jgi:hypothetical protein